MKKRSVFFSLLLSAGLIPGLTAGVAKTDGHDHDHAREAKGTYVESLPKAESFKDFNGKVQIERTTVTKILDEKGNVTGTKTFKKNTSDGEFSTQASTGAQKVSVLAVADAQYRAKYSDWQTRIVQIVEQADVMFNRDHSIDFVVEAVAPWTSSGSNSSQILSNLQRSFSGRNYKFVVGFTANSNFDAGGIAYVYNSKPNGSAFSVNLDQGTANTAKAATHEFSHNFGLNHDAQGSGIRCIMNYDYAYTVDVWDSAHNSQISRNKAWYQ
ncbi:zinc-dependent metalloprotease [Bacillus glycinifermentans]|uniref:Peptidase M84 n=1 Tax=Bacillus glycinifermentans TaxID=1664069 RepID=A0A0T6BK72_9BACI|nr:zinc-dependent metalloprotease [Bacillus glycinifermentans]ATH93611.1 peptidase M84 [Bacillus glycinifermentans]KRT90216.1 peptidase M84 [Bacillus glycinifermentans]MEC0483905.1 zinc-dependent metalloprotease [Bacillus glycinifermentans]UOY87129.1 zinc-dependent metalloprotease [Bacillus glycinifermentans]